MCVLVVVVVCVCVFLPLCYSVRHFLKKMRIRPYVALFLFFLSRTRFRFTVVAIIVLVEAV